MLFGGKYWHVSTVLVGGMGVQRWSEDDMESVYVCSGWNYFARFVSFSANACFWLDFGVGMGVLKDVFPNSV